MSKNPKLEIVDFEDEDVDEAPAMNLGFGLLKKKTTEPQKTQGENISFRKRAIKSSHERRNQRKTFEEEISETPEYENEEEINKAEFLRVKQNFCVFILTLISTLFTGMENIYVFIIRDDRTQPFIFLPSITFRIAFSLIASYSLCQNFKVLGKLYLTVDKLFVTEIIQTVAVFAYVTIYLPYSQYPWFFKTFQVIYPIMIFSTTGYFRVILLYADWKPIQVIAYKLCLLIGAVSFFVIGIFYTVTSAQFTNGRAPEADLKIKQIIFLFIFAGFTFFSEMFDKMDNVDGTARFNARYKLEVDIKDMKALIQSTNKRIKNSQKV